MSSMRSSRKVAEMTKPTPGQDAESQLASDYAPKRTGGPYMTDANGHVVQVGSGGASGPPAGPTTGGNGKPYLTDAVIAPSGNMNMGDPIRLTQMAGPALDQIGKATADKIELSALTLVENARSGAETIRAEAEVAAADMVASAEAQAADMRELAAGLRAYADRKAAQVGKFCAVAESILTTVHALGSNFQSMIVEEEAEDQEGQEKLLPMSLSFLNRNGKATTT